MIVLDTSPARGWNFALQRGRVRVWRRFEEVITQLRKLTPEQLDQVARMIGVLGPAERPEAPRQPAVPVSVGDVAVRLGWPEQLFTEVIGSLPDFARAAQPPEEKRTDL